MFQKRQKFNYNCICINFLC